MNFTVVWSLHLTNILLQKNIFFFHFGSMPFLLINYIHFLYVLELNGENIWVDFIVVMAGDNMRWFTSGTVCGCRCGVLGGWSHLMFFGLDDDLVQFLWFEVLHFPWHCRFSKLWNTVEYWSLEWYVFPHFPFYPALCGSIGFTMR